MKSIEKYLPDARRIVRFEFFNYEGPKNIPTYEVYCDDIMISCSSIRN